jgi:deoxyribonuclease IV
MRKIGLHFRLNTTLLDVAQRAAVLHVPIFQCFFIHQESNKFITISDEEAEVFVQDWRTQFDELYLHGSYWINLGYTRSHNKIILQEIEAAKRLAFTHIIVHPGAVKKGSKRQEGLATIARNLNEVLKVEHEIKIVLENTAHGGLCAGGDLQDFYTIRQFLDQPERVLFCLDTAHAFAYGYDITTAHGQQQFLKIVDTTMGLANIALIHLNDISTMCGSRIDKHERIGDGKLGDSLRMFVHQTPLKNIPLIMELPVISQHEEEAALNLIRSWEYQ